MQPPITEAAMLLGDRPHALAKAGIVSPGGWYLTVMRQQPMALHACRWLIPNASRKWTTGSASPRALRAVYGVEINPL